MNIRESALPGSWSRSSFLLSGAAALTLTGTPVAAKGGAKVFYGMNLIDGTGAAPLKDAVMLVADGRVVAIGPPGTIEVPSDAEYIDLTGKTVIPALIDAHSHVGVVRGNVLAADNYTPDTVRGHLRIFAACGVHAVQILGTDNDYIFDLKRSQGEAPVELARVFSAGHGFGVPDGQPPQNIGKYAYRPKSADEARTMFAELASKGPDVVKIWVDSNDARAGNYFGRWPAMNHDVAAAVIDEAHKRGLRVAAHLFFLADAKWLIAAGVDIIGHSVRDQEVDDELLSLMRSHGTTYIPTLTIDESRFIYADRPAYMNDPLFVRAVSPDLIAWLRSDAYRDNINAIAEMPRWRVVAATSQKNVGIVHKAGIPVAMGTDSGGAPERIVGYDSHKELELLVRNGFTPLEAINSATAVSARAVGRGASDLGALTPGKRANFIVLDSDPTVDIRNTRAINQVWYGGTRGPDWKTTALHEHERDVAIIPADEFFDPAKGHIRSVCC
jgi:imidazolonepropionase-like amidohydrolase